MLKEMFGFNQMEIECLVKLNCLEIDSNPH